MLNTRLASAAIFALSVAAIGAAMSTGASAQDAKDIVAETKGKVVIGPNMIPVPTTAKWVKLKPQSAAEWSAEALGLLRGEPDLKAPQGYRLVYDMVKLVEYTGSGTAPDLSAGAAPRPIPVEKAVLAIDYTIPAARLDLQAAGGRKVQVVGRNRTWDEKEPGAGGAFVNAPTSERAWQIGLSPHGAVLGALTAGSSLKTSAQGGKGVIAYVRDGAQMKITLDEAYRPARVEMLANGHRYVADYAGYKDFVGYNLICPTTMKQSVDGTTVTDLTLSFCAVNVYSPIVEPGA